MKTITTRRMADLLQEFSTQGGPFRLGVDYHDRGWDLTELIPLITVVVMVLMALVHLLLCFWIYDDARRLLLETRDRRAVVIAPWFWLLAVLVTGIAGLAVYWGIHRSTLNPRNLPAGDAEATGS